MEHPTIRPTQKGFAPSKSKGFTLVEILVAITLVGLLTSIILVAIKGTREKAFEARGKENQSTARSYCAINPGVSTLRGDTVYCDEKYVMWSITLGCTFAWGPDTGLPAYANGDCNNLIAKDMASYPACNACRTLNYAGFSESWRLPSQGRIPSGQQFCDYACGRDGVYCATGRQLWDFGKENCGWDPSRCSTSQDPPSGCMPSWDTSAAYASYMSSTQYLAGAFWGVYSSNGGTGPRANSNPQVVRCFLGQYW